MDDIKQVDVIMIPEIEIAAAMACEGHAPALFDAGSKKQTFWFLDNHGARKTHKQILDNELELDPKEYAEMIEYLRNFVTESIEHNNEYDAKVSTGK